MGFRLLLQREGFVMLPYKLVQEPEALSQQMKELCLYFLNSPADEENESVKRRFEFSLSLTLINQGM
ncbi:hypothetical protein RJT34_10606 [Clitoria ternatea]|uniref:Uncharacterized protein n=1 Tax=Clitoria ternatea TaxID=43366 RepID=A0AAN9PJ93_CLITE